MSHIRESFPILEDASTQAGVAAHSSQSGDASAGKIGITSWVFKDASGNLVHPTLNSEGAIVVSSDSSGVPKRASSTTEVSGSLTPVVIASATLNTSKTHGKIHANGTCFKESVYKLFQVNDATETLLGGFIVGPGQYSFSLNLGATEFTSGATGTQKLELRAYNLSKASDFIGDVSCLEYAV